MIDHSFTRTWFVVVVVNERDRWTSFCALKRNAVRWIISMIWMMSLGKARQEERATMLLMSSRRISTHTQTHTRHGVLLSIQNENVHDAATIVFNGSFDLWSSRRESNENPRAHSCRACEDTRRYYTHMRPNKHRLLAHQPSGPRWKWSFCFEIPKNRIMEFGMEGRSERFQWFAGESKSPKPKWPTQWKLLECPHGKCSSMAPFIRWWRWILCEFSLKHVLASEMMVWAKFLCFFVVVNRSPQ